MLITPLARKLCTQKGIDPTQLRGTGPRGRIMARDVTTPSSAPTRRGKTTYGDPSTPPTRPQKDGYYVYDATVNMQALFEMNMPIAVQSGKLLEQRYSLFDYIIRATIKACCSSTEWIDATGNVNVLLFEDKGNKTAAIPDARFKTIYQLARELQQNNPVPEGYTPHIVICDAATTRQQVADHLTADRRPGFALLVRGRSQKVGIRAGRDSITSLELPYTFYVSSTLPAAQANRIAATLQSLLYSPVSLLLLS